MRASSGQHSEVRPRTLQGDAKKIFQQPEMNISAQFDCTRHGRPLSGVWGE